MEASLAGPRDRYGDAASLTIDSKVGTDVQAVLALRRTLECVGERIAGADAWGPRCRRTIAESPLPHKRTSANRKIDGPSWVGSGRRGIRFRRSTIGSGV